MPKKVADLKIIDPRPIFAAPEVVASIFADFVVPPTVCNAPYILTSPRFIALGRFGVEDIFEDENNDFEFKNLILPTGRWDRLIWAGEQFENGNGMIYSQHIAYSDSRSSFPETPERIKYQEFRISTIEIRYAVMRLSFELRNTQDARLERTIAKLRETIIKDSQLVQDAQHNADYVRYNPHNLAVVETLGWPVNHPFYRKLELALDGKDFWEIGSGLEIILGLLLGDAPEMVKQVFEYHYMPLDGKSYFVKDDIGSDKAWVYFFSGEDSQSYINLSSCNFERPARGVKADARYFHKE